VAGVRRTPPLKSVLASSLLLSYAITANVPSSRAKKLRAEQWVQSQLKTPFGKVSVVPLLQHSPGRAKMCRMIEAARWGMFVL